MVSTRERDEIGCFHNFFFKLTKVKGKIFLFHLIFISYTKFVTLFSLSHWISGSALYCYLSFLISYFTIFSLSNSFHKGIKPINRDWTTEDCLKFQELTANKPFASYIVDIKTDELSPKSEKEIEIMLIDVSNPKDVLIHDVLIEQNRAVAFQSITDAMTKS